MTMMKKYEFEWDGYLAQIDDAKHRIVLNFTDVPPILSAPYCAGPEQREFKREEIKMMREAGMAKRAETEWASPVVFVRVKDGSSQFRDVYRSLIAIT